MPAPNSFYSITAKADSSHAEILIYDEIGPANFWADTVDAKSFVKELQALDVETITLRINSPGGDVFDGVAIYNALVDHPAAVKVKVDGLAASIASVIMLAGDERHVGTGAQVMIHDPWTFAMGEAADLRKTADLLDSIRETILDIYEERTSMSRDDLATQMSAESWYAGAAAVEAGFATVVDDEPEAKAVKAIAKFDERVAARLHFEHVPERVAAALRTPPAEIDQPVEASAAASSTVTTVSTDDGSDEHAVRVRELLTAR